MYEQPKGLVSPLILIYACSKHHYCLDKSKVEYHDLQILKDDRPNSQIFRFKNIEQLVTLDFIAFKADEHHELCEEFAKGHLGVLKKFGITNISTNNLHWMSHPGVWCVIAVESNSRKLIGGIRLQKVHHLTPLPLQVALQNYDANVGPLVMNQGESSAEICALWISHEYARTGLSKMLFWSAISICPQVDIFKLFTLCAKYTLPMVEGAGFSLIDKLGDNGLFDYPNSSYQARVLLQLDVLGLPGSHDSTRRMILKLRRNPQSTFISSPGNTNIVFNCNLLLKSKQLIRYKNA